MLALSVIVGSFRMSQKFQYNVSCTWVSTYTAVLPAGSPRGRPWHRRCRGRGCARGQQRCATVSHCGQARLRRVPRHGGRPADAFLRPHVLRQLPLRVHSQPALLPCLPNGTALHSSEVNWRRYLQSRHHSFHRSLAAPLCAATVINGINMQSCCTNMSKCTAVAQRCCSLLLRTAASPQVHRRGRADRFAGGQAGARRTRRVARPPPGR